MAPMAEATAFSNTPFLRAEWRHLALLNFEVDPRILGKFVPAGTELDLWNGHTYVSVVGFLFLKTRVLGLPIPFHRNFEEVNLRFYVRRRAAEGWRRAVTFIKELVPRTAIAWAARTLYNENYLAVPMSHRLEHEEGDRGQVRSVSYSWLFSGQENRIELVTCSEPSPIQEGSEEEFIAEHYWGYSAQRDGGTIEYRVEHPRWCVATAAEARLDCDVAGLYGEAFRESLERPPSSAFLADGSKVTVFRGVRIDA